MIKIIKWYKEQTHTTQILTIVGLVLGLVLLFFAIAYCIGSVMSALDTLASFGKVKKPVLYYAFKSSFGLPLTIIGYLAILGLIAFSFVKNFRNDVKTTDERGVHFMEDNTYGSSRWMQESEISDSFALDNIKNTHTTIYGQVSDEGEKVVGWAPAKKGGTGNRNVIMLASMGSGKSFCYVRTELIQAALRGDSFVVTDPSAELYTDLAKFLMNNGVDVKVLNLADPAYSEFWNCIDETIDPETERLDSTRLNDFVSIYMQNSGEEGESFWFNCAQNLLRVVIGYTAYNTESQIINAYIEMYKKIKGMSAVDKDDTVEQMRNECVSLPWCREQIIRAAKEENFPTDGFDKIFADIKKYAPDTPFTIGQVYRNILQFNDLDENFKHIPQWHPAYAAYLTYLTNDGDTVKKSALQGIQLRFQIFSDNKIEEILSHDGIHLGDITLRQSAYFVIMSDKSTATKPIASLFFSFLFKDAQDVYDKYASISKEQGVPNPCLDLVTMLDEFFSIGVIGGSPEAFGVTMSNSRKRHIYISIILQGYSQLEALYGAKIKDIIQGGCSTLLYLGGNDPATCDFISKFASGEATVLSESHKEMAGLLNKNTPTDLAMRSDRRFLLTPDEARRWKNKVLVVKQGELPLQLNPFPWIQHPLYKSGQMTPTSVFSNIIRLDNRLQAIRSRSIEDPKTFIYNEIQSMDKGFIDERTGELIEYITCREPVYEQETASYEEGSQEIPSFSEWDLNDNIFSSDYDLFGSDEVSDDIFVQEKETESEELAVAPATEDTDMFANQTGDSTGFAETPTYETPFQMEAEIKSELSEDLDASKDDDLIGRKVFRQNQPKKQPHNSPLV